MARHHYRVRSIVPGPNTTTIDTSAAPKPIAHNARPRLNTDSLIRTWASFEFSVLVTPDHPPVVNTWWYDTYVQIIIAWTATTGTLLPGLNNPSPTVIGTQQLVPQLRQVKDSPNYCVTWTTPYQLDIKAMHKGDVAYSGPSVNLGLSVYDPNDALNGFIDEFSVQINWMAWLHTLWASDSPV